MSISESAIVAQSKNAYGQWKDLWRKHAKINTRFAPFKSLTDFMNIGVGRACLLVANGYSFEENLSTIKDNVGNVDILCCDKTLGHLLKHGIKPTYCLVADAMVNYERYMKPWEYLLDETILIMNVCGNPKWSINGNWKDRYFFVNQDVLHSEREFSSLSGCQNIIAAATNVSNAMVVMVTQSDNTGRRNFFGYDKILLIGFDYCWRHGKKYYAFDESGSGKTHYMKHIYCATKSGSYAYTSNNLFFSAQWLEKYVNSFRLQVVQCSKESILNIKYHGKLDEQMKYLFCPEDRDFVRAELARRDKILKEAQDIEHRVSRLGTDHYYNFIASV